MEYIAIFIIGAILGAILMSLSGVSSQNELLDENKCLYDENKELRSENEYLRKAETRAMNYARKIKQIENIAFGKGTIVDKHDAIVKLLKGEK